MTATTGRLPSLSVTSAIAALAASAPVSGSTMIQPLLLRITVMLARSSPRTCQMPSATWNRPCFATSVALRHRLGFTVAGAGPVNWAPSARSRSTSPLALRILPSGMEPRKPRLAKSKSCSSAQLSDAASAALSACACGLAVGGACAAAEARRRAMRCGVMASG